MSLNRNMLRTVVRLLGQHRVRTPYSILGATVAGLGTNQTFSPQDFGPAVGSMLRSIYGRSHPEASWIVSARTGFPSGYRPGPDFAEEWDVNTRFITSVEELRQWLRETLGR